jgi:hypothetical protein
MLHTGVSFFLHSMGFAAISGSAVCERKRSYFNQLNVIRKFDAKAAFNNATCYGLLQAVNWKVSPTRSTGAGERRQT